MKKLNIKGVNIFKPEISICPKCGSPLEYRYAIQNKTVQFRDGKCYKIKNLAYKCSNTNCDCSNFIFTSQNVNRICIKGSTYSLKVIWGIFYYKEIKKASTSFISNKLLDKDIQMSDKNITILYNKCKNALNYNYLSDIEKKYKSMIDNYGKVALFINVVNIELKSTLVIIKNGFNSDPLGYFFYPSITNQYFEILDYYFKNKVDIVFIYTQNNDLHHYILDKNKNVVFYYLLKY